MKEEVSAKPKPGEEAIPMSWTIVVVLFSFLPAVFTVLRVLQGEVVFGIAGDPQHAAVAEQALMSFGYTFPQVMGLCAAVLLMPFCFTHFMRTGEIASPLLAVGLLCVTLMDVFQVLAAHGVIPIQTDTATFIPLAWTLSRAFYAGAMIEAFAGFLRWDRVKGRHRRLGATAMFTLATLLLVVVGAALLYLMAGRPGVASFLYARTSLRMVLNLAPLVILLLLACYVLPIYLAWRRTVFAQALLLSCVPLVLAQIHFAFGFGDQTGFQFAAANLLKLLAYFCPLLGLVLDYQHTYARIERLNRELRNELFLAEQARGVADYERHALGALLHALPLPACFLDISQNVTLVNRPFLETSSMRDDAETMAMSPERAFGPGAAEEIRKSVVNVVQTGRAAEVTVKMPGMENLATRHVWHLHPVGDGHGRVVAVVCLGEAGS